MGRCHVASFNSKITAQWYFAPVTVFKTLLAVHFLIIFSSVNPGPVHPQPSPLFHLQAHFSASRPFSRLVPTPKFILFYYFFFCIFLLCSFDSIWRDSKNYSNLKWRIFGDLFGSWIKIMPSSESKFVEMDGKNCSLFPMLNRFHSIRFEKWP